jgi:hypothetical protein
MAARFQGRKRGEKAKEYHCLMRETVKVSEDIDNVR